MSAPLNLRRARAHAIGRHQRKVMDQIAAFENQCRRAAVLFALGGQPDETTSIVERKH